MKHFALAALSGLLLIGCQASRDFLAPPGQLGASGKVNKCNSWGTNPQACGEAIYNAPRVAQIQLGQPIAEVRKLMGRQPEQRSLTVEGGIEVEVWQYLTDYYDSVVSVITFRGGQVHSLTTLRK